MIWKILRLKISVLNVIFFVDCYIASMEFGPGIGAYLILFLLIFGEKIGRELIIHNLETFPCHKLLLQHIHKMFNLT